MAAAQVSQLRQTLQSCALPLRCFPYSTTGLPKPADLDPLLQLVGDAHFVLIGEASHGTDEFYRVRAELTKRLIAEKGFHAVAVEADFPDAYRCLRYVTPAAPKAKDARDALSGFQRFPTWMWRNTVVTEFLDWLKGFNHARRSEDTYPVGFYGLDLYSMNASMAEVVKYLDAVGDTEAAMRARKRFSCFDLYDSPQEYGMLASCGVGKTCEEAVYRQLRDMLQRQAEDMKNNGFDDAEDELFMAQQNARVVANSEKYYRTMFSSRDQSWNVRDTHMSEVLWDLEHHLEAQVERRSGQATAAKIVVWAHNSHLGDARFTESTRRKELNLGQLVRMKKDRDAVLIGFTTNEGTVTAASNWDEVAEKKTVRPGMEGSYERLFHELGPMDQFALVLRDNQELEYMLPNRLLERAIGVIYRPDTERYSHYFHANIARQFDAIIHLDKTTALIPLEPSGLWHQGEAFETYPTGY